LDEEDEFGANFLDEDHSKEDKQVAKKMSSNIPSPSEASCANSMQGKKAKSI
jgi:hypothetical protein